MSFDRRPGRILVAEDDASAREAIELVLGRDGHRVTSVSDGDGLDRALHHAESSGEGFDLLLTDVRMPGAGTFSVLGRRARRPRTILLTAYPEDWVFFHAYQLDCLCVLSKPFDVRELRRIVALVLADRTLH